MQSNYRFSPQEDITVLELAEILNVPDISGDIFGKLPQRIQRHFTAQMTFANFPKTPLTDELIEDGSLIPSMLPPIDLPRVEKEKYTTLEGFPKTKRRK